MLASLSCKSGLSLCLLDSSPFCLLLALLLCPLLSLLSDGPRGGYGAGDLDNGDWGNLVPVSICDSEELSTEEGGWGARDEGEGVTWEAVCGARQRGEGGWAVLVGGFTGFKGGGQDLSQHWTRGARDEGHATNPVDSCPWDLA